MKIAIYLAGGHEKAFKEAEKELKQYLTTKMWSGHEFHIVEVSLGDSAFLHDMQRKYHEGYKLISMGRYSNNLIADLSGTNIIEPSKAHLKGAKTIFDELYYGRKAIKLDYNDGMFVLDFEVLPMMHPLYSVSNKEQAGVAKWVSTIRKFLGLEGEEKSKECKFALTYRELYDYVMARINTTSEIRVSYDIESNFVPAYMVGFDIIGFSLSFGNSSGIYAVLEAREYQMTAEDREKSLELLKWVLSNPKTRVVVHNSMYELPTTLNRIDYEIPRDRLDDTLVMSKILNSGFKGGNSLKAQAVYRLGYTDWSKDLDIFRSALMDYVKALRGTASSKKYLEAESRREFQEDSLCNNTEALRVLCKYYDEDSAIKMLEEYRDDLIMRINAEVLSGTRETHILSYGYLPMKLLATYGAIDSIATIELYDFYKSEFARLSELYKIDLNDGYSLWMESMYAGYKLELNSSRWDESQASVDEEEFRRIMKESMIQMLHSDSPAMRKHVTDFIAIEAKAKFLEDPENVKKYIESSPKFQGYTGTGRYRYSGQKAKNGELQDAILNVAPNKTDEVLRIFEVSKNAIDMHCRIFAENKIKEFDKLTLEELQAFLNPASDKGKDLLTSILHEEFLAGSRLILDLIAFKNSESYKIEVANGRFNDSEIKFIEKVATYNKNWKIPEKGKFFDEVLEELSRIDIGASMSRLITSAGKWRIEGITEPDLTAIYELYTVAGFDIDSDYQIEGSVFSTLFHLRRYKKVLKMLDVYINGDKLGRNQVYVVDKDELQSGKKLVRRKRKYEKGEVLADNEDLVYQGTWNPNSVMTGRWSSPIHCLVGDTKVILEDGSSATMEELYNLYKGGQALGRILSINPKGEYFMDSIASVTLSGYVDELTIITLENKEMITCTTDHRFLGSDLKDYRAYELFKGQRLKGLPDKPDLMIVDIETFDCLPIAVYDLSVRPENPYFALSVGVVSHNTMPASSDPKRYMVSRYDGGCVSMPDFSQAELRTVAKAADDSVLMKAYEDGIDVHMVTAMGVYRRPASEITEIQRRYTKMCCSVGDTKIRLLDGVDTIENLYNKWKENPVRFEVPSYCKDIGIVAGTVVDVQLTRYTKELVKVTYTDGSTHTTTPDHWLLETGDTDYYIQVQASEGTWIEGIDYNSPTRNKTHRKLVDNVEFITLEEPVPVYDLSVDKYHNYVIDFDDGTGVFTHNTFRILYGGTAQSVADEFFNGNLSLANEIFNGFFDTYYGVKNWMDKRHAEIKDKGVVTTMSNRFIKLGFEAPGIDLGKIMRQAGNAPDIEARI